MKRTMTPEEIEAKPQVQSYQYEKSFRAYDGARLTWRRQMGQWQWQSWELVRVEEV